MENIPDINYLKEERLVSEVSAHGLLQVRSVVRNVEESCSPPGSQEEERERERERAREKSWGPDTVLTAMFCDQFLQLSPSFCFHHLLVMPSDCHQWIDPLMKLRDLIMQSLVLGLTSEHCFPGNGALNT